MKRTRFEMPVTVTGIWSKRSLKENRAELSNEARTMTRREVRHGRTGRRECTVKGGR